MKLGSNSLLLLLALLISFKAISGPLDDISRSLKEKKFVPFKNLVNNYPKKNIEFRWEILRTIVGDYKEGVLKIVEYPPLDKAGKGGYLENYSIYLIVTENDIITYKFTHTINEKIGNDKWVGKHVVIDSLNDVAQFQIFENLFKHTYGVPLNKDELFLSSIVYGFFCGYSGQIPEFQEKLYDLVKSNNINEIRSWLKSPNAEKQVYAMQGYLSLIKQGYVLSEDEKRIFEIIKKKEGNLFTCSGCIYSKKSIQKVISEFDFTNKKL